MATAKQMLICSPARGPGSGEAVCSECAAPIYPTMGSLRLAREHAMKMICTNCASAAGDYIFGGLMHHGQMVPITEGQAAELLGEMEKAAHRHREEKRKADKGRIQ